MKINSYRMMMGVAAVCLCLAGAAQGQMVLVADPIYNRVSAYDATTGASINANFLSGVLDPRTIAYGDGYVYVANTRNNTVGKYDAFTGVVVDPNFITTANIPWGLTYSNGSLFVSNYNDADATAGYVAKYSTATGAIVPDFRIDTLSTPALLTSHNGNLYVPSSNGLVGLYSEAGVTINASFITEIANPLGVVVVDGSIFVTDYNGGRISQFDLATGDPINLNFITGLDNPTGITVNSNGNLVFTEVFGDVFEYTTAGVNVHAGAWFNAGNPAIVTGVAFVPAAVPEPGTSALIGLGVLCGAVAFRKKYRTGMPRLSQGISFN